MLTIDSPGEIRRARRLLDVFYERSKERFIQLFVKGKIIPVTRLDLSLLEDLGLVEKDTKWYRSRFMICNLRNIFIVTDPPWVREYDRVFPIFDDESVFLARNLVLNSAEIGLDIGTGSGILAIAAARKAKRVVATDINQKVESYVRLNSILNSVEDKVEFRLGNVYESLDGERFDFLFSNPPFVPVPPGSHFYVHSDGGPVGLKIIRSILSGLRKHLKRNARLQMLALSLSKNCEPIVIGDLRETFANWQMLVTVTDLYNSPLTNISRFTERFARTLGYAQWNASLRDEGFAKLYYLHISARPSSKFEIVLRQNKRKFIRTAYSGSWSQRLNRYVMPQDGNGNTG